MYYRVEMIDEDGIRTGWPMLADTPEDAVEMARLAGVASGERTEIIPCEGDLTETGIDGFLCV